MPDESTASQEHAILQEVTAPLAGFLQSAFGKPGLILHGSVAVKDRQALVRRFQEDESIGFFGPTAWAPVINNLVVSQLLSPPLTVGMADHNQDELNGFSRRTLPELMKMARQAVTQAYADAARPTAELVMPQVSEYAIGQLMQMLMLATVVEARLLGVNPYGQPGADVYKQHLRTILKSTPNLPAEVKG